MADHVNILKGIVVQEVGTSGLWRQLRVEECNNRLRLQLLQADVWLTPKGARTLAGQLQELARRVEQKNG